jgi:hypothetical protein
MTFISRRSGSHSGCRLHSLPALPRPSSVALVLPTKSTGISFPSVSVSVTMRRFVSVLRVLIYLLMMNKR